MLVSFIQKNISKGVSFISGKNLHEHHHKLNEVRKLNDSMARSDLL